MKKLIIILFLASLTFAGYSQTGLFKPVPKNYFTSDKALGNPTSSWLPRLNVGLNAMSYGKNPETKLLEVTPLNAICFGIGYLHYKNVEGVPFNDFGFNLAYLQLIDKAGSGVGLYGTYNTGQIGLLNLGGHYDFAVKQFFFDTGVSWHF
jgi:hypothetical protein